jgi:hypothetical protein
MRHRPEQTGQVVTELPTPPELVAALSECRMGECLALEATQSLDAFDRRVVPLSYRPEEPVQVKPEPDGAG